MAESLCKTCSRADGCDLLLFYEPETSVVKCSHYLKTDTNSFSSGVLFTKAINFFGKENQINMALEEMAELTDAICKFRRGRVGVDSISEEIADVLITLKQLQIIFECQADVDKWSAMKLKRLEKALQMGEG